MDQKTVWMLWAMLEYKSVATLVSNVLAHWLVYIIIHIHTWSRTHVHVQESWLQPHCSPFAPSHDCHRDRFLCRAMIQITITEDYHAHRLQGAYRWSHTQMPGCLRATIAKLEVQCSQTTNVPRHHFRYHNTDCIYPWLRLRNGLFDNVMPFYLKTI